MGAEKLMNLNPDLIHYLCIAKSTTILAHHFNNNASIDSSNIETLASQCLSVTPQNHSFFSHTVNNRIYIFLIEPPFVFFAIFDHTLLKPHALSFLKGIKSSLRETLEINDEFAPFSLQKQLDSVLSEALKPVSPSRSPVSTLPPLVNNNEGLMKKKKRVDEKEAAIDVVLVKVNDRQKAKHIWKKHVWVVLLIDLLVCAVLFVIWLWVCSGFQCMAY